MKTVPGAWPIDELRGAEVSACFKFIRAASWSGSSVMSFRKCSWPRRVGLLVRAGSRDCCGHPPTSGAASRPHRSALWPRVAVRGGGVAGSVRNGLENSRGLATTAARSSSSASPVRPRSALGYRPPAPPGDSSGSMTSVGSAAGRGLFRNAFLRNPIKAIDHAHKY